MRHGPLVETVMIEEPVPAEPGPTIIRRQEEECQNFLRNIDKHVCSAMELIVRTNRATISHFQRHLRWGYNSASQVMERLEGMGVLLAELPVGPRKIVWSQEQIVRYLAETKKRGLFPIV